MRRCLEGGDRGRDVFLGKDAYIEEHTIKFYYYYNIQKKWIQGLRKVGGGESSCDLGVQWDEIRGVCLGDGRGGGEDWVTYLYNSGHLNQPSNKTYLPMTAGICM